MKTISVEFIQTEALQELLEEMREELFVQTIVVAGSSGGTFGVRWAWGGSNS